jgi:hypothetical protein
MNEWTHSAVWKTITELTAEKTYLAFNLFHGRMMGSSYHLLPTLSRYA